MAVKVTLNAALMEAPITYDCDGWLFDGEWLTICDDTGLIIAAIRSINVLKVEKVGVIKG